MSVRREEPLQRVRMSWEEFLALPEWPRAEWVDGEAVIMNAPPVFGHGNAVLRLGAILMRHLPEHHVTTEGFLRLPRNRVRLPDLALAATWPEDGWMGDPRPLLCVEVLSPSTRSEDMVHKSMEYAEGGIGQYWLVDLEARSIEVMRLVDGAWEVVVRLDEEHPEATVELAGIAVPLDVREIVRR